MLAAPNLERPFYGLVTNGSSFIFLKLLRLPTPTYAKSREFLLNQDNGLEKTLQIMKRIGNLIAIT
jgi:hypothetical protein